MTKAQKPKKRQRCKNMVVVHTMPDMSEAEFKAMRKQADEAVLKIVGVLAAQIAEENDEREDQELEKQLASNHVKTESSGGEA